MKKLSDKNHQAVIYTGLPNYPKGRFFAGYSLLHGPYRQQTEMGLIVRYPLVPRFNHLVFLALNYISQLFSAILNLGRLPKSDVYFVFATSPIFVAIPAIILKYFTGRPVLIWYQDLWPDSFVAITKSSRSSVLARFLGRVTRWIYRHTDGFLIQSEAFRSELLKAGYKKSIYYMPNWAENIVLSSDEPQWLKLIPKNKKILTFAGNIGYAQGLDQVLEAIALLSSTDLHFVIVGDGSTKTSLEKQSRDLKIQDRISFLGRQAATDMPALFRRSDYLLVSLKKDHLFSLTVPSKVQAYMQAGKPIIAFIDGEGSRVVLEANCGVAAEAENAPQLALTLKQVMSSSAAELEKMGACGQEYFKKNFTEDLIISRIEDILLDYANR